MTAMTREHNKITTHPLYRFLRKWNWLSGLMLAVWVFWMPEMEAKVLASVMCVTSAMLTFKNFLEERA